MSSSHLVCTESDKDPLKVVFEIQEQTPPNFPPSSKYFLCLHAFVSYTSASPLTPHTKMRLAAFLLAVVVDSVAAQSAGFFLNPPVGTNQNNFAFDPVWILGETQTIQWTTIFSNYSITLWQQNLAGGSATAGPAILSKLAT
jgi:hypothetical protein